MDSMKAATRGAVVVPERGAAGVGDTIGEPAVGVAGPPLALGVVAAVCGLELRPSEVEAGSHPRTGPSVATCAPRAAADAG